MGTGSISLVLAILLSYSSGLLTAREMIARIDQLVASDGVTLGEAGLSSAFAELHKSMALCVWDEETYKQAPTAYIREPHLRQKVDDFVADWGRVLVSMM